MKITLSDLEKYSCCNSAFTLFQQYFGDEAELDDVLLLLKEHKRTDWAVWLARKFGFDFNWGWFSFVDNKRYGHFLVYYDNNEKKYECDFVDGKRHGHCIEYYDNGKKHSEGNYVNDKRDGRFIEYYKNGKKYYECDYVNDKRHGYYIEYYKNGKIKSERKYVNGERIL